MDFLLGSDFNGGMNSDDENRTIPKGEYRSAINIRNGLSDTESQGCVTNVLGNVIGPTPQCPYSTTGLMPDGNSHTIGYYEDILTNSVIYMVWNVNGNHGIYRFYPELNATYQIIQFDFGWLPGERITSINLMPGKSGQLLYWCDSQGLKFINLDRALIAAKQKKWNIYFPQVNVFTATTYPLLVLKDINNNTILNANIGLLPYANNALGIEAWANYLNQNFGDVITAVPCDCHLEITEVGTNSFYYSAGGSFNVPFPVQMIPDNWYGSALGDIQFARAVAPSLLPTTMTYKEDATTPINNVKNHVWQSAIQFYLSDYQQSVLGVASQIPINNLQCDGTNNQLLNYIDIDFNNSDFIDNLPLWLTVITQVGVIVREGNAGIWQTIEILSPCDFLDYDYTSGKFFLHYKFYNDIQGTAVDSITSINLNSGVPITADSEATLFNRIVDGGITVDRDAPNCIEADYSIQIEPSPQKKLHKIFGSINILTWGLWFNPQATQGNFYDFFPTANKYPFYEPIVTTDWVAARGGIFHNTTNAASTPNFPYFGGVSYNPGKNLNFTNGMETKFNQLLPEGGWPVYAAGTDYLTISKQIDVGLPADTKGAILSGTTSEQTNIRNYYVNGGGGPSSTFNLLVPDGVYVIRIASHWCSIGDKLGYGFAYDLTGSEYQKTSTNIFAIETSTEWLSQKEITVTVNGGDVSIGTFWVMDLSPPPGANVDDGSSHWQPINGYLFDSSATPLGIASTEINSDSFTGISVEKAGVVYSKNALDVNSNEWEEGCTTDHNGYFFGIVSTGALQIRQGGLINNPVLYTGNLSDFYNKTMVSYDFSQNTDAFGKGLISFCVATTVGSSRLEKSTFLEGIIKDQNGNFIVGASVVFQNGKTGITDIKGAYKLIIWGDYVTPNLSNFALGLFSIFGEVRVVDKLIVSVLFCIVIYPDGQIIGNILVTPISTSPGQFFPPLPAGYNPNRPYLVPDFVINEKSFSTKKAQKRGGKKIYGLVYCDIAGRVCSVSKAFEAYPPFETEDLSKYPKVIDSATGLPYTVPTVLGGQPTISWSINFAPPKYAAYYFWMWTLDGIYQTEVQWVANSVQYVSAFANPADGVPAINTAFINGNYVGVLISINNMVTYAQTSPGSQVGYTYTAGDRIRLMYDRNNVLLNTPGTYAYTQGIYDFEITGTDSNNNLIVKLPILPFEIQSGFLIEIYTPAKQSANDVQVFYEVGEVYKCTNPGNTNNEHSVTSAQFTSGDTYWRGRLIPVEDSITNYTATYPVVIEAPNVSDFYTSNDSDINPSRTGIINPYLKEVYYQDRLIVSDVFQEGSALNGLSFCNPTNVSDLGAQFGSVGRLIVIGKLLYAVMKNSNVSNTVGVISLQYAQATNTVEAISSDFLGTQYPSRANMGTDFPGAVQHIDGYIYAPFAIRNAVWRHANDGAIEISRNEYGVYTPGTPTSDNKTRTALLFKQLLKNGNIWDATAIYDKQYREYILTVWAIATDSGTIQTTLTGIQINLTTGGFTAQNIGDKIIVSYIDSFSNAVIEAPFKITAIISSQIIVVLPFGQADIKQNSAVTIKYKGQGTTIAWDETKNRWPKTYSFVPECYASLGNQIYAFQNGVLWVQDANPVYNNFFGVQYTSQITFVLNDEPRFVKTWQAFSLMQLQADGKNNWSAPSITNDRGQISRFLKGAFKKLEEFWYSAFKRDTTDISVTNPILNGRPLKSSSLVVTLENDATVNFKLYSVGYNIALSQRTTK